MMSNQTAVSIPENILKFTRVLRELGLRISTAEVLDSLQAVTYINLLDREQVKNTLQAVLVKNPDERLLFLKAFDSYFVPLPEKHERQEKLAEAEEDWRKKIEQAAEDLSFQGQNLDLPREYLEVYAQLKPHEQTRIKDFLDKSSQGKNVDANFAPVIQNLIKGSLDYWKRQLLQLPHQTRQLTGDPELDAVLAEIQDEFPEKSSILYEDLKNISTEDIPKVERILKKLTKKLSVSISRRYRLSSRKQVLDLRKTIRDNLQYGGIMFNLKYRAKKLNKPKLLLICDVSGSMARYAQFVLQFIYGLAEVVTKIESFIFAEDIERVTPYFKRGQGFTDLMAELIGNSKEWGGSTNLHRSLTTFVKEFEGYLTPDTIVIILSDTKTTLAGEAVKDLARLKRRVRDILWLNTLPQKEWDGVGTVKHFAKVVTMYECYTLAHLAKVMRECILNK